MKNRFPAVGASSLLVIFGVLCLVVFALLSIATVQADQRLGDKIQSAVVGYYTADTQAEQILSQLRRGEIPAGATEENGIYSYRCAVSDAQVLEVAVEITADHYEILRWQLLPTGDWQPEEALPVWQGGSQ